MTVKHPEKCRGWCQRYLIAQHIWRQLRHAEREALAGASVPHHCRGLCERCFQRAERDEMLEEFERVTVPIEYILEEWEFMAEEYRGMTRIGRIRNLAPRLGMTVPALDKALERAKRKGLLAS